MSTGLTARENGDGGTRLRHNLDPLGRRSPCSVAEHGSFFGRNDLFSSRTRGSGYPVGVQSKNLMSGEWQPAQRQHPSSEIDHRAVDSTRREDSSPSSRPSSPATSRSANPGGEPATIGGPDKSVSTPHQPGSLASRSIRVREEYGRTGLPRTISRQVRSGKFPQPRRARWGGSTTATLWDRGVTRRHQPVAQQQTTMTEDERRGQLVEDARRLARRTA